MNQQVKTITTVLAKLITESSSKAMIRCYAAMVSLHSIVQNSSWKYAYAAWDHNKDSICSRIGDPVFSANASTSKSFIEDFTQVYNTLSEMTTEDFFLQYIPQYVAQPSQAFSILKDLNIRVPEYVPLSILYAKESCLDPELHKTPPKYISAIFRDKEIWNTFYNCVNSYPFSSTRRKYTSAMAVVDIFKAHNCSDTEYMTSVYNLVRDKLYNKQFKGRKKRLQVQVSDAAAYIRKSKMDLLGTDAAINEAAERIGMIAKPTDFLEVALIQPDCDDCKIEHDFIFTKFSEQQFFSDNHRILIINASPSFILKYSKTRLMPQTSFLVSGPNVAYALSQEFSDAEFFEFEAIDNLKADEYHKVLYFSRGHHSEQIASIFRLLPSLCAKDARIYAVLPSELLTWSDPRSSILTSYTLDQIDLLPKTTFRSAPKKKVLLHASLSSQKMIQLCRYAFTVSDPPRLELVENLFVSRKMLTGKYSIYDVVSKAASPQGKNTPKRNAPNSYAYTSDINFWYVQKHSAEVSSIEAYVCTLPTPQQIKRKKIVRGKKIQGSSVTVSTLTTQEELENWLETVLPYKKRIHDSVKKAFKNTHADTLSFKTLWYLQLDVSNILYSESYEDELALVSSEVGSICYGDTKEFLRAMETFCEEMSTTAKLKYWYLIRKICTSIAKAGITITKNIADKPIRDLRKKDDGHIGEVKEALAVRSFSPEQELQLLRILEERIAASPEYLSVLIRFYTGLTPNIVSALTWKDLRKLPHINCYQLCITKQYQNDSSTPIPFQNAEDYRCVPISDALSAALIARKNQILQKDLPKKIAEYQLIATDSQLSDKDPKCITPRRVHTLSRKVLDALNMADQIVDLPNSKNGTHETNLAAVTRDIFRSNFKYRANITCGFTNAELRYVLGLSQETAFARNYCDYLNDFCQYTMGVKLSRWTAMHEASRQSIMAQSGSMLGSKSFTTSNQTASLLLDIPSHGSTSVTLECQHGSDIHASLVLEKEMGYGR